MQRQRRKKITCIHIYSHTTGYVFDMMQLVLEEIIHDPLPYVAAVQLIPVPQPLCVQLDRPSMEDAVAQHLSRFSQGGV